MFHFQCVMENELHLQQKFYQNLPCSEQTEPKVQKEITGLFFVAQLLFFNPTFTMTPMELSPS